MIEFSIEPDGGDRYTVTADSRDVYVWEKTSRDKVSFQQLMETLQMTEMYRLAHIASRRQGMFSGTLDEFAAGCILHFDPEVEEADPTPPAPTAGSSSGSQSSQASPPRSGRKKGTGQS